MENKKNQNKKGPTTKNNQKKKEQLQIGESKGVDYSSTYLRNSTLGIIVEEAKRDDRDREDRHVGPDLERQRQRQRPPKRH